MTKKTMTVLEAAKALGNDYSYVLLLLRQDKLTGTKKANGEWEVSAAAVAERAAKKAGK